jgi:hypothetical protein
VDLLLHAHQHARDRFLTPIVGAVASRGDAVSAGMRGSLKSTVGVMPVSGLSPPLPFSFSPSLIGRMLRGAPRNAAIMESDSTRNFPSLTEETAYMTVNSANSRVTRSPYGIAQASALTCSSCFFLRAMSLSGSSGENSP